MLDTTREGATIRELNPEMDRGALDENACFWWWMFRIHGAGHAVELAEKWGC